MLLIYTINAIVCDIELTEAKSKQHMKMIVKRK